MRKGDGEIVFDFVSPKGTIKDVKLGVPVDINIENAVAAMAVCQLVGVPDDVMRNAVGTFLGPKRRFEFWLKEPGTMPTTPTNSRQASAPSKTCIPTAD